MANTQVRQSFENWCKSDTPKWPTHKDIYGNYLDPMTQRHWIDWINNQPKCEHEQIGYCGLCEIKNAPKCKEHKNPWYCGHCGIVSLLEETNKI